MRNTQVVTIATLICVVIGMASLSFNGSNAFAQEGVPIKGPKNATDQFSGATYGPITSDDTLWRIADRYRQNKNLSIYQIMHAIYELNPQAFEKQNINLMIDGVMIRLPSERYVARIDLDAARERAERDNLSWERATLTPGNPTVNLKPPSPPINQSDLETTKDALEAKLNTLDASQARQFEALRDQFASSITSVESLLQDNQKLYERIEQVNTDLSALRTQVEGDVQTQMNEQSGLINEMLSLLRQEQQAREIEKSSSFLDSLSSPLVLTIVSALLTLSLLVGAGFWLLKRKSSPETVDETPVVKEAVQETAVDLTQSDDLVGEPIGEDDELDDDDLFNDDDLLDDVLSSELEESLDDELENFSDLSDEMLVPDEGKETAADEESLFEEGDSEIKQDDLDSLFEDENLAGGDDGIDISMQDDELLDNLAQESDAELMEEMLDEDEIADIAETASTPSPTQREPEPELEAEPEVVDEEASETVTVDAIEPAEGEAEAPEISIDELLDETASEPDIAEKIGVDENNLNEDMLAKIDDEIQQQNQELDKLTDNIIGEIEQLEMMGGMLDEVEDEAEEEEISVPETSTSGIQDLDTLAEDLEDIQVEDMANADEFTDPLSDDLMAELQEGEDEQITDQVSDELLAELEQEMAEEVTEVSESPTESGNDELADELLQELEEDVAESDEINDDLSDELLGELEQTPDPVDDLSDELLSELSDAPEVAESADTTDALEDELLAELEGSEPAVDEALERAEPADSTDALADELLEELEDSEPVVDEALEEAEPTDSTDALADELLEELEDSEPAGDEALEEAEPTDSTDALADELLEELEDSEPAVDEALEEAEPTDSTDALADELLEELEDSETVVDEAPESPEQELEEKLEAELAEDTDAQEPETTDSHDELDSSDVEPPSTEPTDIDAISEAMLEDIETLDTADAEDFAPKQKQDSELDEATTPTSAANIESEEIADVPGIDDWLAENGDNTDTAILDELENTDFDELLSAIDTDTDPAKASPKQVDKLDNPDLDLDALLNDLDDIGDSVKAEEDKEDFVSVESLIDEAEQDDTPTPQDDFDLDVSLEDFTGTVEDNDIIDVDIDASQAANLDLARAYIDMDDFAAAKGLLNEVLDQGTDSQVEEAKKLLQELGET